MGFFHLLMSDALFEPTMLVGLIALIGLITQKKPVTEYTRDAVKTVMGFVILDAETGLVISSLGDFTGVLQYAFGIQGVTSDNEAIVSVAQKSFRGEMTMSMFFVMVISIMITRFTPWKFVLLTSHHMLFMSMMVAVILATVDMTGATLIAVDSLVVGVAVVFFPAITHLYMKKMIGSDGVTIDHLSALSYILAGFIGSKFGDREYSTEDMSVPKSLLFLRDMLVTISSTISIIFLVTYLSTDTDAVKELSGDKNWFMFSTIQSITLAVSVHTILRGVCMVIAEITSALKNTLDKLVPNIRPALDYPIVSPYAPNVVLVGFLSSFTAGLISIFTLYPLNMIMIIPGVVPHLFVGTAAGVFGNAMGGRRGAILGAFARGLLITFLPVLLLPVLGNIGFTNTALSDTDFGVLGILLGIIVR